eukprot:TRINITY_DN48168_c0_g1_i1.p1 TRINITY_DN48168_c0_g1~~TRINITY_DN48168_c0_g1_i1.p1  ORF type:complete len:831 (-),score=166.12 TRINITY_DN48168_c0_g1_i1:216-2708(-)
MPRGTVALASAATIGGGVAMWQHAVSGSRAASAGGAAFVVSRAEVTGSRAMLDGSPLAAAVAERHTVQPGSVMTASGGKTSEQRDGLSNAANAAVALAAAAAGVQMRLRRVGRRQRRCAQQSIFAGNLTTDAASAMSAVNAEISMAAVTARAALPQGVYCEEVSRCVRRKTRTVTIGAVCVGSEHPIATQTMTTTLTHDVEATVAQVKMVADAGVDIVRLTVQGMREAKACEHIKRRLLEDGYTTPIVADIHFTPKVALVAADFVDKVRVNPGNFTDGRKSFDTITELTPEDIKAAQDDIEASLAPLVMKLKEKNKALRIGVNHGSLAERILFQYGDSPEGMVASAVEFGEICRKYDFHNFVFSMKSSNPAVMVNAYRLLAKEMYRMDWDYPIHLGVTEAGGGSDGRIKSAVGIGALLLDGLGDTIRVSLTENPEFEAGPCIALRRVAERAHGHGVSDYQETDDCRRRRDGHFSRRKCDYPIDVPLNSDGSVLMALKATDLETLSIPQLCDNLGLRLRKDGDVQKDWTSADVVLLNGEVPGSVAGKLRTLLDVPVGLLSRPGPNLPDGVTLLYEAATAATAPPPDRRLGGYALVFDGTESADTIEAAVQRFEPRLLLLRPSTTVGVTFLARRFFMDLKTVAAGAALPVMLWFQYPYIEGRLEDDIVVEGSADFGSLFVDGLGEGILWDTEQLSPTENRTACFNLLQAARMRISKTEFISCPSCGRTLFNLQETTARIQARTGHLPGVRIAVMGCIVNGPGEMADADFGYVGSGVGKVDLYVNYDVVKRAIPSEDAVDKLVELIKEHGKWVDPPTEDDEVVLEEMGATAVM